MRFRRSTLLRSLSRASSAALGLAMSSYYNNGPRIFTPSTFKTTTMFNPIESFGATSPTDLAKTPETASVESPPEPLNTCHRSRGAYLQQSHPRTRHLAAPALRRDSPPPCAHSYASQFVLFPMQARMLCSARRRRTRRRSSTPPPAACEVAGRVAPRARVYEHAHGRRSGQVGPRCRPCRVLWSATAGASATPPSAMAHPRGLSAGPYCLRDGVDAQRVRAYA